MIRRLTLLVACTLMTTALAMQPDARQALPHRHPITLPLAADTTPRWEDTLHAFALELQRVYQLDEAVATAFSRWILDAGDMYAVPPGLLAALINTESHFRTRAVSWPNAVGPAQVIPTVWQGHCPGDLTEPGNNIICGAYVLRRYYERFCGGENWYCALEYYHTGPGNMAAKESYAQTRADYVAKVSGNLQRLTDDGVAML